LTWQLVTVAPNAERHVATMLDCHRFDHIIFRLRRRTVFRGKIVERLVPAFPGYVFVKARQCWNLIRDIVGVVDFVRGHENLVADVHPVIVTNIAANADSDGVLNLREEDLLACPWSEGDKIRLRGGMFSGYRAVYKCPLRDEQSIVEIDWLGQWSPVNVGNADIELLVESAKKRKRRRNRRRVENREKAALTPVA
jgi:transcription antitermination factor NusG